MASPEPLGLGLVAWYLMQQLWRGAQKLHALNCLMNIIYLVLRKS
jgi:hypothetical protein